MDLQTRHLVLQAAHVLRKANRARRRKLEAELATYTNDSDLNDLYALLDTYPDGQTHEIREILSQQQMRRMWTANRAR
jgi:hypothetical protein